MGTRTPNLDLYKPAYQEAGSVWWDPVNDNMDILDAHEHAALPIVFLLANNITCKTQTIGTSPTMDECVSLETDITLLPGMDSVMTSLSLRVWSQSAGDLEGSVQIHITDLADTILFSSVVFSVHAQSGTGGFDSANSVLLSCAVTALTGPHKLKVYGNLTRWSGAVGSPVPYFIISETSPLIFGVTALPPAP